jgi:hypothetical protein
MWFTQRVVLIHEIQLWSNNPTLTRVHQNEMWFTQRVVLIHEIQLWSNNPTLTRV